MGTPSTINNALLFPEMDFKPRIVTRDDPPIDPLFPPIWTPASLPCKELI